MNHLPLLSRRSLLLASAGAAAFGARAQSRYPDKPVRMVIPFAAGGATDVLGRDLAQAMLPSLGQSFVVENIGGGAGVPALNNVLRSAPDGYTTFFAASGNITAQPLLSKVPADILSQLAPVGMIATAPHVLVVNSKLPYKSVAELIAHAKAHPGAVNFGSAGIGGLAHLGTELFAQMSGIRIVHVPYKGASMALNDLVSGQIQAVFGTMPSFTAMIERGMVRPLGLSAPSSSKSLKGIPQITQVVPGFQYASWNGLFVPARTPATVIDKLYGSMKAAVADKDLVQRFDDRGVEVSVADAAGLSAQIRREILVWQKVIKDSKLELS